MFCNVMIAQVDYMIALSDKNNKIIQVDKILYRRELCCSITCYIIFGYIYLIKYYYVLLFDLLVYYTNKLCFSTSFSHVFVIFIV